MQRVTLRAQKGSVLSLQEEKVRGNKRAEKAAFNIFEGVINMKNGKHWLKVKLQTLD